MVTKFAEELSLLYSKAVINRYMRTMRALEFAMEQYGRDVNEDYAKTKVHYKFQRTD